MGLLYLLFFIARGHFHFWQDLDLATSLVDLGATIYAVVAVTLDGGGKLLFYTLHKFQEYRREQREYRRQQQEYRRQERVAARQELVNELRQVIKEGGNIEDWLNRESAANSSKSDIV